MIRNPLPIALFTLLVAFGAVGCGGPKQVTYVDPNGASPRTVTNGELPVARFGAATMERAEAAVRIRGALVTARVLASDGDVTAAASLIGTAIDSDLPLLQARATQVNEQAAIRLRSDLETLRDDPPAADAWGRAIRQISTRSLLEVEQLVVAPEARQDAAFRAALLYELLLAAGASYESATEADGGIDIAEYRAAFGLLTVITTQLTDDAPERMRGALRSGVTKLSRRALPGPTPPDNLPDSAAVAGELASLADRVIEAANVDPTYPDPDQQTPDRLRSLKRAVASLVESGARGGTGAASSRTHIADADQHLRAAADSIAIIDPDLLAQLEMGLLITLPEALDAQRDVAADAADLDAIIDEAISLVEEELELLRP